MNLGPESDSDSYNSDDKPAELEEGLPTPRSCMAASSLVYFLASCGSTVSTYPSLDPGSGTIIAPDWGTNESVVVEVEGVGVFDGEGEDIDVVAGKDPLGRLGGLRDEGDGVSENIWKAGATALKSLGW